MFESPIVNNRALRYLSLSTLVAVLVFGAMGCKSGGHENGKHDHSSHSDNRHEQPTASQKEYPTALCVVSNEKLGSMGKPVVVQHDGREVQLCCKGCVEDFQKDPKKYLAKLDTAKSP